MMMQRWRHIRRFCIFSFTVSLTVPMHFIMRTSVCKLYRTKTVITFGNVHKTSWIIQKRKSTWLIVAQKFSWIHLNKTGSTVGHNSSGETCRITLLFGHSQKKLNGERLLNGTKQKTFFVSNHKRKKKHVKWFICLRRFEFLLRSCFWEWIRGVEEEWKEEGG